MKKFFKLLFWISLCAAIVYGTYVAYLHWWKNGGEGSVRGISVKAIRNESVEFAGKVGDTAKETVLQYAKNTAAGFLSSVSKRINSFAASIVGESTSLEEGMSGGSSEKTTSSKDIVIGSTTNKSSSSGSSSISSGDIQIGAVSLENTNRQEFLIPPPFATIVARAHAPFSFSINRAGVSYTITWGDGSVSKGIVPDGNSFIVSHEWGKRGDYTVQVDIRDGGTQKYFYSFPVRIYE